MRNTRGNSACRDCRAKTRRRRPSTPKVRTRVVVPLVPVAELGTPITGLNPVLRFEGRDYAFVAQSLATLTLPEMGERVGSLGEYGDKFAYAIDILLTGF